MDLSGKIVIVTGGGRGIGKALTDILRERGATVVTCSLEGGNDKQSFSVDVTDPKATASFVHSVLKQYGRIDILVNNAGWSHDICLLEEMKEDDYERCVRTNLGGVFHMMHDVLPIMKKQGEGIIANIASRAGTRAHPGLSVYSATKFGVKGLTQGVARELTEEGSAVRCFSVSPNGVDTEMFRSIFGAEAGQRQSPESVAAWIVKMLTGEFPMEQGADVFIIDGRAEVKPPILR